MLNQDSHFSPPCPPPPSDPLKRRCCSSDSSSWPAHGQKGDGVWFVSQEPVIKASETIRRQCLSSCRYTMKDTGRGRRVVPQTKSLFTSDPPAHSHSLVSGTMKQTSSCNAYIYLYLYWWISIFSHGFGYNYNIQEIQYVLTYRLLNCFDLIWQYLKLPPHFPDVIYVGHTIATCLKNSLRVEGGQQGTFGWSADKKTESSGLHLSNFHML